MDLTNKPIIKISSSLDSDTNIITLTFKDDVDTVLGTVAIEHSKLQSLTNAVEIFSKELIKGLVTKTGFRMGYDVQSKGTEIKFG